MPQSETGKINCVRLPHCGRLPLGALPYWQSAGHWNRSIDRPRRWPTRDGVIGGRPASLIPGPHKRSIQARPAPAPSFICCRPRRIVCTARRSHRLHCVCRGRDPIGRHIRRQTTIVGAGFSWALARLRHGSRRRSPQKAPFLTRLPRIFAPSLQDPVISFSSASTAPRAPR